MYDDASRDTMMPNTAFLPIRSWALLFALALVCLVCACGAPAPSAPSTPATVPASAPPDVGTVPVVIDVAAPPAGGAGAGADMQGATLDGNGEGGIEDVRARGLATAGPDPGTAVPVTPADPAWGNPLAPVTLVVWGDFECPFTLRYMATVELLKSQYGPQQLRVVWKHNPLPFHKNARAAALAAETVFRLKGVEAFWSFHRRAFENQRALTGENFASWATAAGVRASAFRDAFEAQRSAAKIDEDLKAGKSVGVTGTPASFVNGVYKSGAQPVNVLQTVIDEQIREAAAARREGVPAARIYAVLSEKNKVRPPPPASAPPPDTTTVWRVPVDGSPVRGKPAALVTLIMFADFQCPFCAKSVPTVESLLAKYGDKLRLVFKHNPLPFHPRAEPAAELASEARAQKGDEAFWRAWKILFENQTKLDDADLEAYAAALSLDMARVKKAIAGKRHAAVIERDLALSEGIEASGTPHFFINGRRLIGAQASAAFEVIIDEEITRAQAVLRAGTPPAKLYDVLQKGAKSGPPFQRILVQPPTKDSPAKGAKAGARVTVQMFGDFECPFTKRVQPVIDELIAAYPGKMRVVWRHNPLPHHKNAVLAAEASVEAFKQKGDAGFWALAKRLFDGQGAGMSRASIEGSAAEIGLDMTKLRAALDAGTHRAAVEADKELAERAFITGTPSFAINDYFVSGAQPLQKFKRAVEKALGPYEAPAPGSLHTGPPAPPPAPAAAPPSGAGAQALMGAKHILIMYAGSRRAPPNVTRSKDEARALAAEVLKKARAGADFAGLAVQYSDEPGAAARGGDLGRFPKSAMVPEFGDAVEKLSVGALGGVVETPFGFHVILRTQ